MGICLSLCGRTGNYKPRQMEEEDRARNSETHHNVYRKSINAQSSEEPFGSMTVAQSCQSQPIKVKIYGDTVEKCEPTLIELLDFTKDLVYFEGMDSPAEWEEMKLTEDQKAEIKTYFSKLTQNEFSFCYQYFPPHLPPGPDGLSAKHLKLYLEKEEPEVIYDAIEYLRQRQFNKLNRALSRLSSFLKLKLDDQTTKSMALKIFHEWQENLATMFDNTKSRRAQLCFQSIFKVVPYSRFAHPHASMFPWILFQVLHPIEENSGILRIWNKNLVESASDREQGVLPPAVASVESRRKSTLIASTDSIYQRATKSYGYIELRIINDLFKFYEVHQSTMANSIPIPSEYVNSIRLCYYTIYKHFSGDALTAVLNSKAPSGSLEDAFLQGNSGDGNSGDTIKCHGTVVDENQTDRETKEDGKSKRNVDGNPVEELKEEGESNLKRNVDGDPDGNPKEEGESKRNFDGNPVVEPKENDESKRNIDGNSVGELKEEGGNKRSVDVKPIEELKEDGESKRNIDGNPVETLKEEVKSKQNVDGKPTEEQKEENKSKQIDHGNQVRESEGEIMHLDESMTGDAHNEEQEEVERELGIPRREEFFEIKERAEKQKRWKRRFDGTNSTETDQEETTT